MKSPKPFNPASSRSRPLLPIKFAGMFALPVAMFSAYLWYTRSFLPASDWHDFAAIVASTCAGMIFLWNMCRNWTAFVVFAPTFLIAGGLSLFLYGFWFVGHFFGDGLEMPTSVTRPLPTPSAKLEAGRRGAGRLDS